jgi:hypothetical protein
MKHKDFLARLASLEIKPAEQVSREFEAWRADLSEEDVEDYALNLAHFALAIGLPLERLSQPEAIEDKYLEALSLYAQALWKAYAIGPEVKERLLGQRGRYLLELQASDKHMERMLDKASVQQEQALERKVLLEDIQEMVEEMRSSTTKE